MVLHGCGIFHEPMCGRYVRRQDARWGRGSETFGEDVALTSALAVAFVQGLQGNHSMYKRVVATPKHFTACVSHQWLFPCLQSLHLFYLSFPSLSALFEFCLSMCVHHSPRRFCGGGGWALSVCLINGCLYACTRCNVYCISTCPFSSLCTLRLLSLDVCASLAVQTKLGLT